MPPLFAAGEQVQLEAPAGLIDDGSPEENVRREALEEVGLRLHTLEFVGATYSCASLTTEKLHLYLAPYGARTGRPTAAGPRASTRTSGSWRWHSPTSPGWRNAPRSPT